KEPWMMQRATAWVQVTSIGLQGHVDAEQMLVWATGLSDGKPLAGVELQLANVGVKGKTDAKGLAKLPLVRDNAQMVVARKGDDVAFLPESIWWWNPSGSWHTMELDPELRWYVFDDRGLYRPGEDVKIKGWIRAIDPRKGGDVDGLPARIKD